MSKQGATYIDIVQIKSWWHPDLLADWQPNRGYIDYIKQAIRKGDYLAPVIVVKEDETFWIVNGHHRVVAHLELNEKQVKCIILEGTFEESEPLRQAEVLLKKFDRNTGYRYQFSGYLDRWAAAAEKHEFINKYRPTFRFRIRRWLKRLRERWFGTNS